MGELLSAARHGTSGTLVLRGEPGIGKTALLDHAAETAPGVRILRVTGVEAESELGYAGLHRFLLPILDRRDRLPAPQRGALGAAFGLTEGPRPDPFLIGLAVLTLLTDHAEERPVLCVCDDAQWLDHESLRALAFVGRRLQADRVALLFGLRCGDSGTVLDDLPWHRVTGLCEEAAHELLATAVTGRLDPSIAGRIVAETRGNPLAIRELGGELVTQQVPAPLLSQRLPMGRQLEARFLRQVRALPAHTQTILLIAAADPTGDPDLVWRAAVHLRATGGAVDLVAATEPAIGAGLVTPLPVLGFRHPLIRSGVYGAAGGDLKRGVHDALAAVTDREADADRRAWHLAAAAGHPDEGIATELENSAHRARLRGGYAAQATLLTWAADLSPQAARRTARLLAAAEAALAAGHTQRAEHLLDRAEPGLDTGSTGHALRLRGLFLIRTARSEQAIAVLLRAAALFRESDARPAAKAPGGNGTKARTGYATESLLAAFDAAAISPWLTPHQNIRELATAALHTTRPDEVPFPGAY